MVTYMRVAREPDGTRQSYAQRSAARRAADAERRKQNNEPSPDPIYNLSVHERQRLRYAEAEGRREGAERAAIEEQARKQAELAAIPEHERRPPNVWRQLIEARKADAWRPEVRRRLRTYEAEAKREDERIDGELAARKRQHELESAPEYARALAHWDKAHLAAETEQEKEAFARLKGLIAGGGAMSYWDEVAPIMQARLAKLQEQWDGQIAKQAATVAESKALAAEVEAVSELQVKTEEAPVESGELTETND